jgi:hypothetical protein
MALQILCGRMQQGGTVAKVSEAHIALVAEQSAHAAAASAIPVGAARVVVVDCQLAAIFVCAPAYRADSALRRKQLVVLGGGHAVPVLEEALAMAGLAAGSQAVSGGDVTVVGVLG